MSETFLHYSTIISNGPLMIVCRPYTRQKRRNGSISERPTMPWRHVLKAITVVMRSHGLKLKDVYAVEGMGPAAETPKFKVQWETERTRLEAAFGGDPSILPDFWLYEWSENGFKLIRSGVSCKPNS
jgi:hypothetical protein